MKTLRKIQKRIYAHIATYALNRLYKYRITPITLSAPDGMIYHIAKRPIPITHSSKSAWVLDGDTSKKYGQCDDDIVTLAED